MLTTRLKRKRRYRMADLLPPVLARIKRLGFKVFLEGAYNLNIFGIRSANRVAGRFDDLLGCAYRESENGPLIVRYWQATTDPGTYWLENPMRAEGTAIYKPGQYRGAYEVGYHNGKYLALTQTGAPVQVYRDGDRDNILDLDESTVMTGYFGVNIHKAGTSSTSVGKWSAGCQVFAREADFDDLMGLVEKQVQHHPTWTKFTYTLLDAWE
jgi:hypothetical protein